MPSWRFFFVISCIFFDPVLFFTFLFSQLNSQKAIKIYSSKGAILLWSASPFVCDINLMYFSCDGIDTFGRTQLNSTQLFINYHKFYRKQYPLPAVSRLASRGEQWLHICNTYTDRSQERLVKETEGIRIAPRVFTKRRREG